MPNEQASGQNLLSATGLSKSYAGVPALAGVDFTLRAGELHALLGQNGAGKSTFIKLLAGVVPRDGGEIEVFGDTVEFRSSAESRDAGIAVVYQELSLVPQMTVAANLFLGREPRFWFGAVKQKQIMRRSREFLREVGFPLAADARVEDLPFAYKQMTEIAKALLTDARILVLDEPTSALTEGEEEVLFAAIRKVLARGVGIIYVTHRLKEVFALSDRVTVFRDGTNVAAYDTASITMRQLVADIVGPSRDGGATAATGSRSQVTATDTTHGRDVVVELDRVSNERLNDVTLQLRAGEILGIAGALGSGRTELLETIFGLRKVSSGEMRMRGKKVRFRDAADAIGMGIGLAPEDRHLQGLALDDTIERNVATARLPQLTKNGFFLRKASERRTKDAITDLSIKATGPQASVASLSGGNQQKVVFAKWRDPRCEVLLLDEPTVGVDVGARDDIYRVARSAAADGTAVVVVSSDFAELLELSDRICVFRDGHVDESRDRREFTGEEHLHAIVNGVDAEEAHHDNPSI